MFNFMHKQLDGFIYSAFFSRLRSQTLYLKIINFLFKITKPYARSTSAEKEIVKKIEEDGYIKIENFLSNYEFEEMKIYLENLENFDEKTSEGFSYKKKNISNEILEKFVKFKSLDNIAKCFYKLNIINTPKINYQKQYSDFKISYNLDQSAEKIHSDRIYKSLKFFFYITDTSKNNFPFCYCKKTNTGNLDSKFYDKLFINFNGDKKVFPTITEKLKKEHNIESEEEIYCKKNTLLIADTSGLHRRGSFVLGSERVLLQGNYQNSVTIIGLLKNILLKSSNL